jgi:two-component system NtrC family response regulator
MMDLARKLAPSDLSVLIQGETGVGKEVLAKWLHEKSDQGKGSFIAVNCGAIPENLIESTLFGHKRGAFTGAVADQTGKFILAHGGTIFLDEVADLPLAVQGKLLRVLQERVVEPVGATRPIAVQVRVLCASHKNLKRLIEKGEFREDLYYRLAEVTLEIPPLRERPEDVILICQQYLKENKIDKKLSPAAWEWLPMQKWTGNVRELLSNLKRAALLSSGKELEVRDFLVTESSTQEKSWLGAPNLEDAIRDFQQEKVKTALKLTEGNRKNAADLLGINQRTLFRYLEDIREEL